MAEILIIEDDTYINHLIFEALKKEGYHCQQAFSGTEGLLYSKQQPFSLVILDLMLPGLSGEELLPQLKSQQDIPVLVLSAKDSIDSKVNLLYAGADDYMTKPFEIHELVARVHVRLKNAKERTRKKQVVHGEMTVDFEEMSVKVRDSFLSFTRQEYKILELLILNPNRIFTKQDIYDYAWEDIYLGEDKTIHMHISNIRKKLKAVTREEYIETVWGIGFKMASASSCEKFFS